MCTKSTGAVSAGFGLESSDDGAAGDIHPSLRDLIGVGVESWVESEARSRGFEGITGVGVDLVSNCIWIEAGFDAPGGRIDGISSIGSGSRENHCELKDD